MRSTRTSAAWAAVAMTTSLLGLTIVGAESQTSVATGGVARCVTLPKSNLYALTSDNALYLLKPGASPAPCRDLDRSDESMARSNSNLSR